jgi:hypothetical protein
MTRIKKKRVSASVKIRAIRGQNITLKSAQ